MGLCILCILVQGPSIPLTHPANRQLGIYRIFLKDHWQRNREWLLANLYENKYSKCECHLAIFIFCTFFMVLVVRQYGLRAIESW